MRRKLPARLKKLVASKDEAKALAAGIEFLASGKTQGSVTFKDSLPEQPFDAHLLKVSPLYRKSRKLYFTLGGRFQSSLISTPRTLSSPGLLYPLIHYSPIESEMTWAAREVSRGAMTPEHLLTLRTYTSSLFHEQNHRIVWSVLPSAPKSAEGLRSYLNLAESLVIVLDMALGDELGPELARLFYLAGVIYDPGTDVRDTIKSRRTYRNYLQAALYATYLHLELYGPLDIPKVIHRLFPALGPLADRAATRSGNLDSQFITRTNLIWQQKNRKEVIKRLCHPRRPTLELGSDPLANHQHYLLAENLFDKIDV
jgi:hypothetical protein